MGSEVFSCDLDPDTRTVLQIYLFTNVQNVEAIRNNIVQGAWNCSVVKASLVADFLQVAAAANKAVVAQMQKTMVTKTVYAEIIYNLSLTKNISQSLIKFGIDKDNSLLFCFLITDEKDETESIIAQIEGEQRPVSELPNFSDMKQIKSAYKLNNEHMKKENCLVIDLDHRMNCKLKQYWVSMDSALFTRLYNLSCNLCNSAVLLRPLPQWLCKNPVPLLAILLQWLVLL